MRAHARSMAPNETDMMNGEGDSFREALAGLQTHELREMGTRLSNGHEGLECALAELQAEQEELRHDNAKLRDAVELMLADLRKLNIGADNLREPQLAEGPLDFVGRYWEKVRPRDSAVQVNEHLGEIRKPDVTDGGGSSLPPVAMPAAALQLGQQLREQLDQLPGVFGQSRPQELGKQVAERGQELHDRVTLAAEQGQEHLRQVQEQGQEHLRQVQEKSQEHLRQVQEKGQALGRRLTAQLSDLSTGLARSASELLPATESAVEVEADGEDAFSPQHLGRRAAERGQELRKNVADRWASFSSTSPFFGGRTASAASDAPSFGSLLSYITSPGQMPSVGASSAGPDAPDEPGPAAAVASASSSSSSRAAMVEVEATTATFTRAPAPAPVAAAATAATASTAGASSSGVGGYAAPAALAAPSVASGVAPAPAALAPAPAEEASSTEEEKFSPTVLVHARLTLDDGCVVPCLVTATDRCPEVASRFISEHSLKATFEAPLRAYLQKIEADAVQFPVEVEANLMDLRREYVARGP